MRMSGDRKIGGQMPEGGVSGAFWENPVTAVVRRSLTASVCVGHSSRLSGSEARLTMECPRRSLLTSRLDPVP